MSDANKIINNATPEQLRNAVIRMTAILKLIAPEIPWDCRLKDCTFEDIMELCLNNDVDLVGLTHDRSKPVVQLPVI